MPGTNSPNLTTCSTRRHTHAPPLSVRGSANPHSVPCGHLSSLCPWKESSVKAAFEFWVTNYFSQTESKTVAICNEMDEPQLAFIIINPACGTSGLIVRTCCDKQHWPVQSHWHPLISHVWIWILPHVTKRRHGNHPVYLVNRANLKSLKIVKLDLEAYTVYTIGQYWDYICSLSVKQETTIY